MIVDMFISNIYLQFSCLLYLYLVLTESNIGFVEVCFSICCTTLRNSDWIFWRSQIIHWWIQLGFEVVCEITISLSFLWVFLKYLSHLGLTLVGQMNQEIDLLLLGFMTQWNTGFKNILLRFSKFHCYLLYFFLFLSNFY